MSQDAPIFAAKQADKRAVLSLCRGRAVTEGGGVLTWTGLIRRNWEGPTMWYLKLRIFIARMGGESERVR